MGLNDDRLVDTYYADAVTADIDAVHVAEGGLRLMGWSVRESAGSEAVATLRIMNGVTVADGTPMTHIELAASCSETEWIWPGIDARNGITVDHVAGTFDVIIHWAIMQNRG